MCGIAGVLQLKGSRVEETTIKRMTDKLIHRGPDGEGLWISNTGEVGLGHRRLSIIDLSEGGKQPMHSNDSRFSITFNGEIYNYIELREELKKLGHQFHTECDTEVLLKMYQQYGKDCLSYLDGMFAFVIWDDQEKELFCARDRFGEKPLYYYKDSERFIFASEIKALWETGIQKHPNHKMIYDYLLYGSVQDPQNIRVTFYEEVYCLEQAHCVVVKANGEIKKWQYWNLDEVKVNNSISFDEAKQQFFDLFERSIKRRMRSDVPLGSSLSGGIDSSSIVALINQLKSPDQTQKTFSARFKNFKKDEGKYIDLLLSQLKKIEGKAVFPDEESVISNLEKIIYHQDQPFKSLSIAAQYEVMKLARTNGVIVLLDGQGADEYLGGYDSFYYSYYNQLRIKNKKRFREEKSAFEEMKGRSFNQSGLSELIKSKSEPVFKKLASLRRKNISPTSDYFNGLHPDIVQQHRHHENPLVKSINFKEQLKQSVTNKGLSELLRYADSNSMANSLEVRLPFLDHQLVEFVFSLPDDFLIQNAWTKYLLRETMNSILPEDIVWRKEKIGFEPPQNKWLKDKRIDMMVREAEEKLLHEKIIHKVDTKFEWEYLMIANYL